MEHSGPGVTTPSGEKPFHEGATEADDVSRAARGDRRAFERLYRAHVGRIHSMARRMVGFDEANESTQDVFVRAWEKIGTFRGESAFGTWLYRLAVNVMLARRAKFAIQRARHGGTEDVLDTLTARPAQSDLGMDFEASIARLPEGARQVFVLHDVEGFKHEEIGRMLGVTSGTSKAQLHRARMMLRRSLGKNTG
jgi:RNA polymerase sigma-70 factor (ECF subfamily)